MKLSAKAVFDDNTRQWIGLLISSQETLPTAWLVEFRKAARGQAPGVIGTPRKTGALRRNIITRKVGNQGEVAWRLPYAYAQNLGRHTQHKAVRGANHRDGGYGTIGGARSYRYRKYTTPNTGPGFANAAFRYANSQIPQIVRAQRLTK